MFAKTKTGVVEPKTISFKWKVEQFFANSQKPGDYYISPTFPIKYSNQITELYLTVYPKGEEDKRCGNNFVSLHVCFNSENDIEIKANVKVSVVAGHIICHEWTGLSFESKTKSVGWPEFACHNEIQNCVIDDTLTILCEVVFQPISQNVAKNVYSYCEWLNKIKNAFDNYEELLESGSFTDVTFNVQDKKINVHKAILSCRSPVFKAMFEHDMKENKQNSVDVIDIDYHVMKELFRFIYSEKVQNIEKIASQLLIAADKYSMEELKALCEKTLYDKLAVDNAIECLKLTEMCDTIHLKKLIIKFVAAHYKEVAKKPGFVNLGSDVMHQIILAIAEKD